MLKCWNHSPTTRHYAITCYQTLEKVFLQLGLNDWKNSENDENFPKG